MPARTPRAFRRRVAIAVVSSAAVALAVRCAHPTDVIVPFPSEESADAVASAAPALDWAKLGTNVWQALPARAPALPAFVWWEGENPSAGDFPAQSSLAPENDDQAAALSGGKWLATDGGKPTFAEYSIVIPREATWNFAVRTLARRGPFRWRFDAMPWTAVDRDAAALDEVPLRGAVHAVWISAGTLRLAAGKHTLRVELTDAKSAAAFDAFVLVDGPFVPHGKRQPGEKWSRAPAGWFAFEPDLDPFEQSPIDLRGANEGSAGEHGFVQVHADGFVREKGGEPVVFWGVSSSHELLSLPDADLDYFARHLAKAGVNLVRLYGPFWRDGAFDAVDASKLARLHVLVAALKKQGIYLALSIYSPLWVDLGAALGVKDQAGKHAFLLAYFDERVQRAWMAWWKQLLASKDPHTGLSLVDEPTLAIAELVADDGTLVRRADAEAPTDPALSNLEKQFGDFLKTRYGSVKAALEKWGGPSHPRDQPATGRAHLASWQQILEQKDLRARDTVEFLARLERAAYEKLNRYLKQDLGFKGATVCANSVSADARLVGPLDEYARSACDVMDHAATYGRPPEGDDLGRTIDAGQRYDDASALRFDPSGTPTGQTAELAALPVAVPTVEGKPSILNELAWTAPNRFRGELPLLAAAYGALEGNDGPFFFGTSWPDWDSQIGPFSVSDPAMLGQFPAAALAFRRGLVKRGEPVAEIDLGLGDLNALRGSPALSAVDPLAPLVGPLELRFADVPRAFSPPNLSAFVDRAGKVVRSNTGELVHDFGAGLLTVNAPRVQAAAGFLGKAGRVDLADVRIDVPLEYGALIVVALDDKPLATSARMLVQVFSEEANWGSKTSRAGSLQTIDDAGGPPIVVRELAGGIVFKRPDVAALRAEALDPNGYAVSRAGDLSQGLPLLPRTLAYVVSK